MENFEDPPINFFTEIPDIGVEPRKAEEAEAMMERQVLEIAPDLVDIAKRAMIERPDIVIGMDKGARIFCVPLCRFISNILQPDKKPEEEYNPHLTFFNDSSLKDRIIKIDQEDKMVADIEADTDMRDRILKAFSRIGGRKLFVIDETLSGGRSLRTVLEEIKLFNGQLENKGHEIDIHFFSLSRDPDPSENGSIVLPKNHQQFLDATLDMAANTDHFQYTLYDHPEHFLFSKLPAFRYVLNYGPWTRPVGELKKTFAALEENPVFGTLPAETRSEFLRRKQVAHDDIPKILRYVGQARERIYESMARCYNEKSK